MKVRIDERLEDAQMIKSWAEFLKAKKIIIANDEIEKMDLEKEIIRMSIDHIRVDFIQVEKLKDKLENEDNKESLIFVKKPE
ncbi:PTS sugar transporter subunit IIB, partial [Klebsiella pneumoniae]|nr:PTS sugar transporter subunit IIB [Klebsiella pneumoniae]